MHGIRCIQSLSSLALWPLFWDAPRAKIKSHTPVRNKSVQTRASVKKRGCWVRATTRPGAQLASARALSVQGRICLGHLHKIRDGAKKRQQPHHASCHLSRRVRAGGAATYLCGVAPVPPEASALSFALVGRHGCVCGRRVWRVCVLKGSEKREKSILRRSRVRWGG